MADVTLMGLRFDALTERETIERVLDGVRAGRGGWVIPTNLDVLRQYAEGGQEIRGFYGQADLVVADGTPLVWASRLQGTPLPERVAGSTMLWTLSAAAAERGASVFLLGGDEGAAEQAAARLVEASPGLRVAGVLSPPFGFDRDPAELERTIEAVRAARPDVVYVALGFPKQERLIAVLRERLPGAWFVGVGISFSFAAGMVQRAPVWMQRLGLEWVHRLVQEPRRLAGRYLRHGLPFAVRLLTDALAARRPTTS
jgi:N-acetylglucosaminyldiphosphoundecaprenol N-acetyl-beta-D-mannosaminyltransferase